MKLDVDLSLLEKSLGAIGGKKASIGNLRQITTLSNPLELQLLEGGEVVIERPEDLEKLTHPAGLIAIGNTQVSLHILHPNEDTESLSLTPAGKTRYHVAECRTLHSMRDGGRFDRYVAGKRLDGLFTVTPYDRMTQIRGEKMEAQLAPCYNCLMSLDYKDFKSATHAERRKIIEGFRLEEFFEENKSIFRCLPLYTSETMPAGDNLADWSSISRKFRERKKWTCECCNVELSKNKGLLHSHHKDGNKGNNKYSNLRALCVTCHKAQPHHGQMHVKHKEKFILMEQRAKQNLPTSCDKCRKEAK